MQAIEALIWLKPTEEGGRVSEIWEGYRPHICITDGSHDFHGQPIYMYVWALEICTVNGTNQIEPGESGQVLFWLCYFDADKPQYVELYAPLQPGREFEIREGGKTVGTGCVQSRISD